MSVRPGLLVPQLAGDPFLRQSCQVAGPVTSGGSLTARFPLAPLGPGGRVIAAMCISGNAQGTNACTLSGTDFVIDVGDADGTNLFSTDILFWDEESGDPAFQTMTFRVGTFTGTSYMACWAGEWTEQDQTNYGFQGNTASNNGNVDYDASYSWTGTGQDLSLARSAGNNFNYSPAMGIWVVGGKSPILSVDGQSFNADGYVTDNANIWMAVQTGYVDATGKVTARWSLSGSGYYNAANLTFKTLSFPG